MFEWLEGTRPALWVGESLWGYPIMLALHAVGLATVVGIFVMRDLRLLGAFRGISFAAMTSLFKLAWAGFLINAVSGSFLFSSQATLFVTSTPFLTKITLILTAAVLAVVIHARMHRAAPAWDESGASAPASVKALAVASLACWVGAISAGRLVAYL